MALKPKSETVGAVYDVFVKVFELLTGGFSISPDGFNKDVKLPKGSLLKVDEDTRTATPIKTAVLTATADDRSLRPFCPGWTPLPGRRPYCLG